MMTLKEWDKLSKETQTLYSFVAFYESHGLEWRSKELYKRWKENKGTAGDWRGYTRYMLKRRADRNEK